MQRTSGTAVKMLLRKNGINIEDDTDLNDVADQLEDEAKNIKIRLDSLVKRYGLISNMIGAVNAYKIQQGGDITDINDSDSSKTIIPT